MTVTNPDITDAPAAEPTPPKRWRPWPVLATMVVAVVALAILVLALRPDSAPSPVDPSTTGSTADTEREVLDACHRSILERAADHPVLGAPDATVTWESNTLDHPAVGRYDVDGFVIAGQGGTHSRFSYTCRMVAQQSGDGSGQWIAGDNGFQPAA